MALAVPVIIGARESAKRAPCISNLRQLYVSWSGYLEENDNKWPSNIAEFASNASSTSLLRCPRDFLEGANRNLTSYMRRPVSYYYLMPIDAFRSELAEADTNHGIMYCVLHGAKSRFATRIEDAELDTTGTVLRLRADGSVGTFQVRHMCSPVGPFGRIRGRPQWTLLTDARPCPDRWCAGANTPCD